MIIIIDKTILLEVIISLIEVEVVVSVSVVSVIFALRLSRDSEIIFVVSGDVIVSCWALTCSKPVILNRIMNRKTEMILFIKILFIFSEEYFLPQVDKQPACKAMG